MTTNKTLSVGDWLEFPKATDRPNDGRCQIREFGKMGNRSIVSFSHNVCGTIMLRDLQKMIAKGKVKYLGSHHQETNKYGQKEDVYVA